MRVVYEADQLFDAHLVRGRLAAEGIEAWVRGEFLAGGIGELPLAGLLAVCVADADAARATALIAAWRQEPPLEDDVMPDDGEPEGGALLA